MKLSDFQYDLPPERIAQNPVTPRDACKLLILNRKTGEVRHDVFRNLPDYLFPDDLLVLNNTEVMPARLYGKKSSGGNVELLLLREIERNVWDCLVRPGRRLPVGTALEFDRGVEAEIIDRSDNGTRRVRFFRTDDIRMDLPKIGEIPYPPYVKSFSSDPGTYQTVYAKESGSVAAPTAGLHFTPELLKRFNTAEITLHVGWGTFRPVKTENIVDHQMEKEWYSLNAEAAKKIQSAKRIVAVGTTSCRVLEGLPSIDPSSGWINLFIYPGFDFKRVDALITNFHLPGSTLLMLVCAFAGRDHMLHAYEEAIRKGYRFYSFGDAMLIL